MKALFTLTLALTFALTLQAQPLTGWVDMHAHPRGDLAYGRELFYGTPYGQIDTAMGDCKSHHSAWGFGNPHGNLFRSVVAAQTEQQMHAPWRDGKEGYPDFKTWPSWCSILHQQMWIDWIKRAYEQGGLRIMCALAVSSHCIASAAQTEGPQDDKQVTRDLIQGIKDMVASSDFMEIAYTPEDARRIAASGKLVVVLGSEMDNIGNFYKPQDNYPRTFIPEPTEAQVKAELDSLWDMGIRYIFPVHLNNTPFGGTALAMSQLNVANKFVTGAEYQPEEVSTAETGIAFRLEHPGNGLNAMAKMAMPALMPKNVNPGRKENYTVYDSIPGKGHRNSLGITPLGRFAIGYMMDLGADDRHRPHEREDGQCSPRHGSGAGYPVNSGHSGPRGKSSTTAPSHNMPSSSKSAASSDWATMSKPASSSRHSGRFPRSWVTAASPWERT
ncbi:MAG: hypothetical protein U0176_22365 [Bacteroidia bacterium]